jgi:hypothetical protein
MNMPADFVGKMGNWRLLNRPADCRYDVQMEIIKRPVVSSGMMSNQRL